MLVTSVLVLHMHAEAPEGIEMHLQGRGLSQCISSPLHAQACCLATLCESVQLLSDEGSRGILQLPRRAMEPDGEALSRPRAQSLQILTVHGEDAGHVEASVNEVNRIAPRPEGRLATLAQQRAQHSRTLAEAYQQERLWQRLAELLLQRSQQALEVLQTSGGLQHRLLTVLAAKVLQWTGVADAVHEHEVHVDGVEVDHHARLHDDNRVVGELATQDPQQGFQGVAVWSIAARGKV
mmetsp:Transcript_125298/g.348634  ORF Transcript_125298/g.348634 Transcript_125298/m.348634 type:complete len:237 (+) Transcript_125298:146-856(+)